jgi:hypothetical protein
VGAWPNSLPDLGMSCESGPSDTLHTTHALVGERRENRRWRGGRPRRARGGGGRGGGGGGGGGWGRAVLGVGRWLGR